MKTRFFKIITAVVILVLSTSFVSAQTKNISQENISQENISRDDNVKGTKKSSSPFLASDFEDKCSIAAYYTFPIMENGSEKYGARVELGYLSEGQVGVHVGFAWQYFGGKIGGYKFSSHHLQLPLQFSARFAPGNVPIQLRVGPFLGYMVSDPTDFEWGFQFNAKLGFLTIGYTLPVGDKSKACLGKGLLSLGVVVEF